MPLDDTSTKALLHMDGADASTTFTDESGKAWTATGNAQIDTAQSVFGGASGLFDGTGDYISTPDHADFAFGTGDFTIDFRLRPNSVTGGHILYDGRPASTQGLYITIYMSGTTLLFFTNSADRITGATVLSTGTWYHVALARSGTSTKLFLNGTQEGSTYTDSNNYINGTARPIVGASGFDLSTGFNGWIDELRVSKGVARWTANFTPPPAPYASMIRVMMF